MAKNESDKPRVLILTHFFRPNVGGVETHLEDLTSYLAGGGYMVYVVTYQPLVTRANAPTLERSRNLTIWRAPYLGWGLFNKLEPYPAVQFLYLTPGLLLWACAFMLLHSKSVDVVHAQGLVPALIGRLLRFIWRKRLVVSIHAVYGWLYNLERASAFSRVVRKVLVGADAVLALAERSREEILALGIPPEKTAVFTYWIDLQVFRPQPRDSSRKTLGWGTEFVVLFVGRLIPVKGIQTLVDVAKSLPQLRFVFVGDGPLRKFLEHTAQTLPNISFGGRVRNSDLPIYYSAADVLCVPSQYEEGFGRVIMEALACGCPVVAANKGGIREAMSDAVGILVEPTATELRDAFERMWREPQRLEQFRKNARPYAEGRFGVQNARVIEKAYLIQPHTQRASP